MTVKLLREILDNICQEKLLLRKHLSYESLFYVQQDLQELETIDQRSEDNLDRLLLDKHILEDSC